MAGVDRSLHAQVRLLVCVVLLLGGGLAQEAGANPSWTVNRTSCGLGETVTWSFTVSAGEAGNWTHVIVGNSAGPVACLGSGDVEVAIPPEAGTYTVTRTAVALGSGTYRARARYTNGSSYAATPDNGGTVITVSNPAPTISVSVSPTGGDKPLTVTYSATVTNATGVSWSGGGTGLSVQRTYLEYGTYTETAIATGPGGTAQDSASVTVAYEPPAPPDDPPYSEGFWALVAKAFAGLTLLLPKVFALVGVLICVQLVWKLARMAVTGDWRLESEKERDAAGLVGWSQNSAGKWEYTNEDGEVEFEQDSRPVYGRD